MQQAEVSPKALPSAGVEQALVTRSIDAARYPFH